VTIPSQIRYVQYYGQIISKQLQYEGVVLLLQAIELERIPTFSSGICSKCLVHYQFTQLLLLQFLMFSVGQTNTTPVCGLILDKTPSILLLLPQA